MPETTEKFDQNIRFFGYFSIFVCLIMWLFILGLCSLVLFLCTTSSFVICSFICCFMGVGGGYKHSHTAVGFLLKAFIVGHTQRHFADLTAETTFVPILEKKGKKYITT